MAMVAPVPGTSDVNLSDNWNYTFLTVLPPTPEAPGGNRVDLYLAYDVSAMTTAGPGAVRFHYGNKEPQAMRGSAHLTFVTPFYANHAEPLPPGCRLRTRTPHPRHPPKHGRHLQPQRRPTPTTRPPHRPQIPRLPIAPTRTHGGDHRI
jgi:hypothetical protein